MEVAIHLVSSFGPAPVPFTNPKVCLCCLIHFDFMPGGCSPKYLVTGAKTLISTLVLFYGSGEQVIYRSAPVHKTKKESKGWYTHVNTHNMGLNSWARTRLGFVHTRTKACCGRTDKHNPILRVFRCLSQPLDTFLFYA